MTTRLTDEQIEALRQKAIKWMHPITEEEVIALIDEVLASRSSSGAEPGTPSVDECERIAYGRGFREGVEAAAAEAERTIANCAALPGPTGEACPRCQSLRYAATCIRALSSAPPSPDSGERLTPLDDAETTEAMLEERVRALEEALVDAAAALDDAADHLGAVQHGLPAEAVKEATRLVRQDADQAHAAARALSPQGDGGTE